MSRYVVLMNWTDQGVRNASDSVQRAAQARAAWESRGVTIESLYWTLGEFDLVGILNAPDDATVAAVLLQLAGAGNIRSRTLRAFDESETQGILDQLG